RKRDRDLVMDTREETAKSIAVGIYSLFMGIKLKKHYGRYYPKGKKLNFSKYEKYEKGNYFKIVSD
ncbi:MAG: N-acetylmuramoyl-L-alanine amidase, partial [Spirochaetia bacterium]|nr:N-acetylmuramoyl-L-alanine amidase [Spirochaetia bacterium]